MEGKMTKKQKKAIANQQRAIDADALKTFADVVQVLGALIFIAAAVALMMNPIIGGAGALYAVGLAVGVGMCVIGGLLNVIHSALTSKPSDTGRLLVNTELNHKPSSTIGSQNKPGQQKNAAASGQKMTGKNVHAEGKDSTKGNTSRPPVGRSRIL